MLTLAQGLLLRLLSRDWLKKTKKMSPASLLHKRPAPLTGRNFPLMIVGLALLFHGGWQILQLRRESSEHVADLSMIPLLTVVQILAGAAVSLFGSIGRFEPIRVPDAPKPSWESLHTRNDFVLFHNRASSLADFIEEAVVLPPGVTTEEQQ